MTNFNPFLSFDESRYLGKHPDLQTAHKNGIIRSGWEHFIDYGFHENREGVPTEVYQFIENIMDNSSPLPYPPEFLRKRVHGAETLRSFRNVGRVVTLNLISALQSIDSISLLSEKHKILDFGCGCGRVIRYLHAIYQNNQYIGTDIDPESITWCQESLSHIGDFSTNSTAPPLAFKDVSFDLIFSISVFTHLPENMQFKWLEELQRITKPGGLLLLTTHGETALPEVSIKDEEQFKNAGFFYLKGEGTDGLPDFYQNSYHRHAYIMEKWSQYFEIIKIIDRGVVGFQDMVICRRRP
ncbi:MAG: ubiquinone/menaquinone biosynthesis C-methylase UbiE [Flavobacterium sp.]|jgi:ubiquinone/menaquinone biosynthesis C-methylase UbiE